MNRRSLFGALIMVAALGASQVALAEKYEGVTVTIAAAVERVQKAAADALTVLGVEIKKNEPGYLEGPRSRKFGAFVGSGGEVLSVKITDKGSGNAEVTVRTTKTFMGRAGQKVWDQQMIDEINKSLAANPAK
jgi:hypothetical protein